MPLSLGDQGKGVRPQLWYTRGVQENGANRLVVLQIAEILVLIIIMFRNTFPMRDN